MTGTAAATPCWYAEAAHRPPISRVPDACNGPTTHAERLGDGSQRFYCEAHAYWRAGDVGADHVRTLRDGEAA